MVRPILSVFLSILLAFGPGISYAQSLLPQPGATLSTSPAFIPVLIKGMKVHPENPVLFDFIVDSGHSGFKIDSQAFKDESRKLIKYFLAALTIKETDLWVNLSPYEKDRMLSADLGQTDMGQEMLAQDYLLKQLTASFMDPDKDLGRKFWDRVYGEARAQFGTSDIPVDTFNKVWIMADKAKVFERDGSAFVVASHLKVMLESDYLAMDRNGVGADLVSARERADIKSAPTDELSKQLIREIILPAIEQEVNEGANFAPLRQMFHSMILATWYKKALKDALLNQVYTDQGKTGGVAAQDPNAKEKIFEQYLAAYRAGVVNLIKEEADPQTGEITPRKYFSGGVAGNITLDFAAANDPDTFIGLKPDGEDGQVVIQLDFSDKLDRMAEEPFFSLDTDDKAQGPAAGADGKKWMRVKEFAGLVKDKKIIENTEIDIVISMSKAERYRSVPNGIISGARFYGISEDGRTVFYNLKDPKKGAEPRSILSSAVSYIAVQGDFAQRVEKMEDVLKSAEIKFKDILQQQFENGDITKDVYEAAVKNTYKNFYEWTTDEDINRLDPSIRQANLAAVRQERWDDIIEAYRKDVSFGTAGIRGKAVLSEGELGEFVKNGPLGKFLKGPNTINAFKLLKTTAGVIKFAKETGRKKIVIGYDSRIGGQEFAEMIARLFIAQSTPEHEFKIFLFDEASPFPELSFGITTEAVKGDIGLLLSASHNPADYNGYKITLGNGSQLNQKNKDLVVAGIAQVKNSEIILADSLSQAKPGQIVWLGGNEPVKENEKDKDYYGFDRIDMHSLHVGQTKKFILNTKAVEGFGDKVKIGYAAFNGAGFKAVPRLLSETGFTNFKVIPKLQELDGTFPAWKFGEQPDPGDPISADIAVKEFIGEYGQKDFDDLDILIGTDPDADRMGLIVKVPEDQQEFFGKYRLLSANDAWTLLLWYRLTMKQQMGLLENPADHTVTFSHVTTDAIEAVAREFGIDPVGKMLDVTGVIDRGNYLSGRRTWVGFTYLAEMLEDMEQAGKFVEMLAEESNGVSVQGHTKEKDGTLAAVLLAEIAAYAKSQKTSIFELLDKVYAQIGHYATANKPLPRVGSFEKAAGISEKIKIIEQAEKWGALANERIGTTAPFMLAGKKVIGSVSWASGRVDKDHYPGVADEGVRFFFEDETMDPEAGFTSSRNYITIRISGTSQTLRFYTQVFSKNVTSVKKASNYHEAERIALEAQKQILGDVGLTKYVPSVQAQLDSLNGVVPDKAQKPEILEINLSKQELVRQVENMGPEDDFIARKTGSTLLVGKGAAFWKVELTADGVLKFYYDDSDKLMFSVRMDPAVYAGEENGWSVWDKIRNVLMESLGDTTDKASTNIQGGIDLNGNAMGLDIEKSGQGVKMTFDPAMSERLRKGDFTGLTPVIIQIIPIASPAALMGLQAGELALPRT
jgi:phosphoglucomutase